jgi:quercetin dioxygenase-like cupin family protein
MKRWDLRAPLPSTEKRRRHEAGADAPRIPRPDRQMPRVLFSAAEFRVVVVDLSGGEEMGEHQVRERALVEVVSGRVSIESSGETALCEAGALVIFDPGERHRVRAVADSRLLLVLAPWPAADHHPEHIPMNAVVDPLPPSAP